MSRCTRQFLSIYSLENWCVLKLCCICSCLEDQESGKQIVPSRGIMSVGEVSSENLRHAIDKSMHAYKCYHRKCCCKRWCNDCLYF